MTDHHGGVRWPLLLVGGVCLVGVGVAVGYGLRPDASAPTRGFGRRSSSRLKATSR